MKDPVSTLSAAFDSLREPLFILSHGRHRCVFANAAFYSFLKLERPDSGVPAIEQFWPDIASVDFSHPEFSSEFRTQSGEVYIVKLMTAELSAGYLFVRVLAGLSRGETQKYFHAQRLETLGMLAGGVAHDFNNILAGILGHVSYLKTILPQTGSHVESLSAVEEGGKKASIMTQQILNFSKVDSQEKPARINMNELVVRTCSLLRGAISLAHALEQGLYSTPLFVLAHEGSLAQILVNLAINSRDALSQGGKIRVVIEREISKEKLTAVFKGREHSSPSYVILKVEDNGHGMCPEVIKRIFEPYYSTKKDKGTGLGLATVDSIVKSLGGVVMVESEVGKGTSVSVYLPEAEIKDVSKTEVRFQASALQGGDETILVIDDEFPVRNVLTLSLQHLGYTVLAAGSGVEGIELFRQSKAPVDLVILDMLMPNLPGEKVFFKLRELASDARVLLMSGYTSEDSVKNVLENGGIDFIQKPFTIEELSKKVRECLEIGN